jgi:hypothetical protein
MLFFAMVCLLLSGGCSGDSGKKKEGEEKPDGPVPIAHAGEDQRVWPGEKVFLDGTKSVGGDTWEWTVDESSFPVGLSNPNSPTPHFRAVSTGGCILSLRVGKNGVFSKPAWVIVSVNSLPRASFESFEPQPRKREMLFFQGETLDVFSTNEPRLRIVAKGEGDTVILRNNSTGTIYPPTEKTGYVAKYDLQVDLEVGENRFELAASDDFGHSARQYFFVSYNPTIEFLDDLKVNPSVEWTGETVDATFTLMAYKHNQRYVPEKFDLYRVDDEGRLVEKVGEMREASDKPGGTYETTLRMYSSQPGWFYYKAVCEEDGGLRQESTSVDFGFFQQPTKEEYARAKQIIDEALDQVFPEKSSTLSKGELDDRIEALAVVLQGMEGVDHVKVDWRKQRSEVVFKFGGIDLSIPLKPRFDMGAASGRSGGK